MKPYGKEPFSWKSDPDYQQDKRERLEKLHDKILVEEMETRKDKYGNILKKHIPLNKQPSESLVDSKRRRYQGILDQQLKEEAQETPVHPYQRANNPTLKQPLLKQPNFDKTQSKPQQKIMTPPPKPQPPNSHTKPKQQQKKTQKCSQFLYQRYGGSSGPDTHLIEMLEREVISADNSITMDDIADLQKAKSLLQEAVLLPIVLPNFFQGIRRPWKGVLMFGPPGTGKTMLAKAIASSGKMKFFNISASSLASKWKGESEKLVRLLFEMARFYAPSVVFVDEIDSIASRRSEDECEASRKVKTELLVQLDGAGSSSDKPVILIAATNRPWDIDQALRRRLEKRIYIPLPTENGRRELFVKNTTGIKLDPNVNLDLLAQKTKGFSGADIVVLIRSASFLPLRRYLKKTGFKEEQIEKCKKEVDIPLTQSDFLEALQHCNPSVGAQDLGKYSKWMQEFGST